MSESEHSSDEQELLINTRQRRSNAGNRLQKLLEQEIEELQTRTQALDEDEIDLLFKEDEEDADFEMVDDEDNESHNEEENEIDNADGKEESEVPTESKDSELQDEDVMLSDSSSEDEPDNQDDESGEKELIRQERLKKKKLQKLRKKPLVIKRTAPIIDSENKTKKRKVSSDVINAEDLLSNNRRTSSRSSVIQNKLQVYEKLSQAEKRRQIIRERMQKSRDKEQIKVLTQEDRMRIALETEQANLLSLNKYKEQEVSKKQHRLAMQQRQKMKFKPGEMIITELSTTWEVTPVMEIEDYEYWKEQIEKRNKKKKKYPRKPRKKNNEGAESHRNGGDVCQKEVSDTHIEISRPIIYDNGNIYLNQSYFNNKCNYQKDNATDLDGNKHMCIPLENNSEPRSILPDDLEQNRQKADYISILDSETNNLSSGIIPQASFIEVNNQDLSENSDIFTGTSIKMDVDSLKVEGKNGLNISEENSSVDVPAKMGERWIKNGITVPSDGVNSSVDLNISKFVAGPTIDEEINKVTTVANDDNKASTHQRNIKIEECGEDMSLKHAQNEDLDVTASIKNSSDAKTERGELIDQSLNNDVPNENIADTMDSEEQKRIYEGPNQMVSKNFVVAYTVVHDTLSKPIHDLLFGSGWKGPPNKSYDTETLFVSKNNNGAVDDITSEIKPDLTFLEKYPAFGEFERKVVQEVSENTAKDLEINIKTAPPTGIFLPSGMRKKCLINNKDCHYFDPKNGVPYSDVEAYKIIQELQSFDVNPETNHFFKWQGFANGGIFLDVNEKPAEGVPDNF